VRRHPPVLWCCVIVWCAVCGWFAFVNDDRVPLISLADFGFHELGHMVMYAIPVSQLLTAAMGSIMQCAVPLGLAAYFCTQRKDGVGATACLAWAATNFQDVSVYAADAPYERLDLVGGQHDWAYILGPQQLDRLDQAAGIASAIRGVGVLVLLVAFACAFAGLYRAPSNRTPAAVPDAGTGTTPDDLFPTASRTQS